MNFATKDATILALDSRLIASLFAVDLVGRRRTLITIVQGFKTPKNKAGTQNAGCMRSSTEMVRTLEEECVG